jgi:hypothetical protein
MVGGSPRRKSGTYTGRHEHRKNVDIHASSGIRNHDPSVRTSENMLYLRSRGRCDRVGYWVMSRKYEALRYGVFYIPTCCSPRS